MRLTATTFASPLYSAMEMSLPIPDQVSEECSFNTNTVEDLYIDISQYQGYSFL